MVAPVADVPVVLQPHPGPPVDVLENRQPVVGPLLVGVEVEVEAPRELPRIRLAQPQTSVQPVLVDPAVEESQIGVAEVLAEVVEVPAHAEVLADVVDVGRATKVRALHPVDRRARRHPVTVEGVQVAVPPDVVVAAAGERVEVLLADDGRRDGADVRGAVQDVALDAAHAVHRARLDHAPAARHRFGAVGVRGGLLDRAVLARGQRREPAEGPARRLAAHLDRAQNRRLVRLARPALRRRRARCGRACRRCGASGTSETGRTAARTRGCLPERMAAFRDRRSRRPRGSARRGRARPGRSRG